MSDTVVMDKPVDETQTPTVDAPKSAMEQFTGLFGFGKKAPVEQPTQPNLSQPDLSSAGLGNDIIPPPPSAESISSVPPVSVAPLDPKINTVDDLLAQGPQTVEVAAPPEQTPAEKLKQQIADSVDAFLKEVTKEKIAV